MGRVAEAYFHLLKFAIAACLVAMIVLVFGNVVLRYGFNAGITTSEELSRFFFVWLIFLGAIVALREHAHLGFNLIVESLPAPARKTCLVVSHVLMLYATWLFLKGSWQQTLINLDVTSPAAGVSMGMLYGAGIVFSVSAGLILLCDLFRIVTGDLGGRDAMTAGTSARQEELEALHPELGLPESAIPPLDVPTGERR